MTLKQLEYFVAVADSGSVSGAARHLHISQPPLSMQIRELEEELGTSLLERTTRHMRLTDAGHLLYDKARAILDLVEETRGELESSAENIEGKLIIGYISSCGNIMLTPQFTEFSKTYPKLDFELLEGHTYAMIDKLMKREIDLAFLRTPFNEAGLDCRYFPEEKMCAVGTRSLLGGGDEELGPVSLQELSKMPLIIYRRFESLIRSTFRAGSLPIHVKCLNDDARTSLMWAAAGTGVCLVPSSIAPIISGPDIVTRTVDCGEFTTHTVIACRQGQYLSPAARKFLAVFEEMTSPRGGDR